MRIFGLIGYPLSHSFSEKYFTTKFLREGIRDAIYKTMPIDHIDKLPLLISETQNINGLNVTIPYKEQVMKYIHSLDPIAQEINAVNTLHFTRKQGQLHICGHNTDAWGFEHSIKPMLKPHHKKALVLGTGGAAKAVEYVLRKLGIQYLYVSRTAREGLINYCDLNESLMNEYTIVINTSPVGMYPNIDSCPYLPYECITPRHIFYDLVYNPEETKFMRLAKEKGAATKNGLEMLHLQAEKAWMIWNDVK